MKKRWLFAALFAALCAAACLFAACAAKPQVVAIEVEGEIHGEYALDEEIDFSSLVVVAKYTDMSEKRFAAGAEEVEIVGGDTSRAGEASLTVRAFGLEKIFAYTVRPHILTLDMNGGLYEGQKTIAVYAESKQADVSAVKPTKSGETPLKFAGWFYDKELTERVEQEIEGFVAVRGDITLYAGYDVDYGDAFTYEIRKDGVALVELSFDYTEPSLTIPATVDLLPVVEICEKFIPEWNFFTQIEELIFPADSRVASIGAHAFYTQPIASVNFPEGLEVVGAYAFANNHLYGTLELPASLKRIEDGAFSYNTNLEEVIFAADSRLTLIGTAAFSFDNSLQNVILPPSLEEIRPRAFEYTDIRVLEIPAAVHSIGLGAFKSMNALAEINVAAGSAQYSAVGGNLYSKDGGELIRYCFGKTEETFCLPDTVRKISDNAFSLFGEKAHLKKIVLNEGLTEIGGDVFSDTDVEFTLPASLRNFDIRAFYGWHGKAFSLSADNPYFAVKDGALYSKDFKELHFFPQKAETVNFVLDDRTERIKSYALCKADTLRSLTIGRNSNLKIIDESGFVPYAMKSFNALYLWKAQPFSLAPNACYSEEDTMIYDSFHCYAPAASLTAYRAAWADYSYPDSSFDIGIQNRLAGVSAASEEAVSVLENDILFTPFAKFGGGVAPRIRKSLPDAYYDILRVYGLLEGVYTMRDDSFAAFAPYFAAFEEQALRLAIEYYGEPLGDGSAIYKLNECPVGPLSAHFSQLPADICESLQEYASAIESLNEREQALGALQAEVLDDLLNFELGPEVFDKTAYLSFMEKYGRAGGDIIVMTNSLFEKFLLLQCSAKIDEFVDMSFSADTLERAEWLVNGDDIAYELGIEDYLYSALITNNLRKQLYRFGEYGEKLAEYEAFLENFSDTFCEAIGNFDAFGEYNEDYAKFARDVGRILESDPALDDDTFTRAYYIMARHSIRELLAAYAANGLGDENVLALDALRQDAAYYLDGLYASDYPAESEEFFRLQNRIVGYLDDATERLVAAAEACLQEEGAAAHFAELARLYEHLRPLANDIVFTLSFDETDIQVEFTTLYEIFAAAAKIDALFRDFPVLTFENYAAAESALVGAYDAQTGEYSDCTEEQLETLAILRDDYASEEEIFTILAACCAHYGDYENYLQSYYDFAVAK